MVSTFGILIALLILLLFYSVPDAHYIFSRVLFGKISIQLQDLPILFENIYDYKRCDSPKLICGAEVNVQLHNEISSIMYHRSIVGRFTSETVSIYHDERQGLILTLVNDILVTIEYVGKKCITNPKITIDQEKALQLFMARVHESVHDYIASKT